MRLTDISDTDIRLDQNGQPIPDNNGECVPCTGEQCWMQDIWIEMLTEESELLWEDEEGIQAYGFGLTDYLNAEINEAFNGDFSARIISKLTKREYIDEGSIRLTVMASGDGTWNSHIHFQETDGTDINIDIETDGKEIYVT